MENTKKKMTKLKVKGHSRTVPKGPGASRCIALQFLQPWSYKRVGGKRHAPADLPPGKNITNFKYARAVNRTCMVTHLHSGCDFVL